MLNKISILTYHIIATNKQYIVYHYDEAHSNSVHSDSIEKFARPPQYMRLIHCMHSYTRLLKRLAGDDD